MSKRSWNDGWPVEGGVFDLLVTDFESGTVERINLAPGQQQANDDSTTTGITGDGRSWSQQITGQRFE
jgi:hypothetical protein